MLAFRATAVARPHPSHVASAAVTSKANSSSSAPAAALPSRRSSASVASTVMRRTLFPEGLTFRPATNTPPGTPLECRGLAGGVGLDHHSSQRFPGAIDIPAAQ
jgi:hypothetical protein